MKALMLALMIMLSAMVVANPAVAQSAADTTAVNAVLNDANPETLGVQAVDLLNRIGRTTRQYRKYQASLARSSVEDSLVLRMQIETMTDQFMTLVPQLANFYPHDPQTDGERELKSRISEIYISITASVWELLEKQQAEINRLRAERPETAAADLGQLEFLIIRQTSRLDAGIRFAGEQLKSMADLGLDVVADQETYHELLLTRADALQGRIVLGSTRVTTFKARLKDQAGDGDLTLRLLASGNNLSANTKSFEHIIGLMDQAGLDTNEQRTYLVTITQDLASGILDAQVTASLLRKLWQQIVGWLTTNGPIYLVKILIFAVIMFAGRMLARLVQKAVNASLGRARINISQLLRRTLVSSARNLVLVLTVMIALSQLGLDLAPLLAGFGVVGFILGFAMQDSLSNFASGLMILFYRPYDVGDLVDISGVFGKVENMSLVSTSILTLDNQKLVVPNSKIWGDVIKNVTDQHVRRVDMTFGISYTDDIAQTEKVLAAILADNDMVLDRPASDIRLHTLNDSSVDFIVRPWVKTENYWEVYWAVTREVKMRFDAENISIPFPQRDVHVYNENQVTDTES